MKEKKRVAFIVEHCPIKGNYPFERIRVMHELLAEQDTHIFVKANPTLVKKYFTDMGVSPIVFENYTELGRALRSLQVDLIVQDGKDSLAENVERLRPLCKTIIHFDDFGNGRHLTDCNILALFEEMTTGEALPSNTLAGSYSFAISKQLQQIADIAKKPGKLPHIVVAFEDGDEHNLTYRTLRHLTQLHIPLQISLAIDDDYKHSVSDLQMMLLSRKHTQIVQHNDALYELLPQADIVICNNNYTPYKVAALGIACITLAQHEREIPYAFARELNGFIHLGLGRKMKQSALQNAVMELLLHEHRRERAVRKQQSLELLTNNDILQSLLLDFANGRHLAQL